MRILVISGTHLQRPGERLPDEIEKAAAAVDLIVHCGDIETLSVYEYLTGLGRVVAVRGNVDEPALKKTLPDRTVFEAAGRRIGVVHGWGPPWGLAGRVAALFSAVDAVLFGHSHRPQREVRNGVLFFNPGSPTDRLFAPYNSYGILEVGSQEMEAHIVRI